MFQNQTLGFNTTIGYYHYFKLCRKDLFRITFNVAQKKNIESKTKGDGF